ncbi:MAG: response regulator transcription factor [Ruminiclostridium sp.]|nr:response regulator transcription factor [Ruminiclostridium sp.]
MQKIVIIEDDKAIMNSLSDFLRAEGYTVYTAVGQKSGTKLISQCNPDCILLDISLPDGNGFSICSDVRRYSDVPVIFLTASGDEKSVIAGLELGADDYIKKPFSPAELLARIRTVTRRKNSGTRLLCHSNIAVDTIKGIVTKDGKEIYLSALEYRLLLIFISNKGKLFSREQLIDELWTTGGEFISDNTLTVYIKRVREKIGDDMKEPHIIRTVRGLGYRMGDDEGV